MTNDTAVVAAIVAYLPAICPTLVAPSRCNSSNFAVSAALSASILRSASFAAASKSSNRPRAAECRKTISASNNPPVARASAVSAPYFSMSAATCAAVRKMSVDPNPMNPKLTS